MDLYRAEDEYHRVTFQSSVVQVQDMVNGRPRRTPMFFVINDDPDVVRQLGELYRLLPEDSG